MFNVCYNKQKCGVVFTILNISKKRNYRLPYSFEYI